MTCKFPEKTGGTGWRLSGSVCCRCSKHPARGSMLHCSVCNWDCGGLTCPPPFRTLAASRLLGVLPAARRYLMSAHATPSQVRAKLSHPIIDGDGHWVEYTPVFAGRMRRVFGDKGAVGFSASQRCISSPLTLLVYYGKTGC